MRVKDLRKKLDSDLAAAAVDVVEKEKARDVALANLALAEAKVRALRDLATLVAKPARKAKTKLATADHK